MSMAPTSIPDASLTTGGTQTSTETGSWAMTTHSVIWSTNTGKPTHRIVREKTEAKPALVSCTVVAIVTLLCAANLIDVYGSAGAWATAAVPAAVIGALIAFAGVAPPLRLWWQLFFLVFAQWIVGPVICLNDTTIGRVIPSLETLRLGWRETFGSFKYLIAIEPPVGDAQGALLAVWTLCLWTAAIAGFFALLDDPRWSVAAIVLEIAAMCACALLGTADGVARIPCGIAFALVLIVWLSWRMRMFESGRWISSLVIVVLAAAVAFGGCLLLPAQRTILRDHYEPPLSPNDYTSPLSTMRAYIKSYKDTTVLTVHGLPEGTCVRLAVMDRFDGNVWNLSDSRESRDSANYARVGTSIRNDAEGRPFTAKFTVRDGLGDDWLPLAGAATSVRFSNEKNAESFYYNVGTDSGLLRDGVKKGLTYTEHGIIPDEPSDKQIAEAEAARIDQPKADDVPNEVGKLASATAGGKSHGGEAAQQLVAMLRDQGWFSHGLGSDYQSSPGHGNHRIAQLLGGEMVGDSEQYASAMALMARELGLPSRVVLGFLPKDKDGDISNARTQTEGDGTIIDFTGNDVTAWVEINLEGYGWVPFYPTPKETKTPDDDQNLTPPNPQNLVRQPPLPLTDPLRDETNTTSQSSFGGTEAAEAPEPSKWAQAGRVIGKVALYGSPLWIVLLIVGAILLGKAIQLAMLRKRGRPQMRMASGWQSVAVLARQSGIDAHGTRREQAQQITEQLKLDPTAMQSACRQADYATFSGQDVSDEQASTYWHAIDELRAAMLATLPRMRRWRTKLSLRGVRQMKPVDVTVGYHKAEANDEKQSAPRRAGESASADSKHRKRRFSHARH
ncbi:transglutaminase [Bifidobacterium anseris]|uniref:Transglutaminase n=1 Tax=Bifidobacterium anseris TaxID=2020963 RepID=A0A2N5IZJ7_9BIFI|nr:transglutaminase [Bifidobacterium anseris]